MILTCPDACHSPRRSSLLLLLCGALLFGAISWLPSASRAQSDSTTLEAMGPTRYEEVSWHEVIFLNFDSEKARRAKAMTEQCLTSATRDRMPVLVETPSGPWDVLMIYSLKGAPVEKNWNAPADLGKLRADCASAFGEEKAEGAWEEYQGLIVQSSSMVGLSGRFGQPPETP